MEAQALAPQHTAERLLAQTLMVTGEIDAARGAASQVLHREESHPDHDLQARALLCLAYCDRASGKLRRAHDAAQKATHLFRSAGDVAGEASALSLLALTCSYLGRDEEAVEAALLSVTLGDTLGPGPHQAQARNHLGLAYLWSGSFGKAEAALFEAERLDSLYGSSTLPLSPRLSLVWVEILRLAKERSFTGQMGDTAILEERVLSCEEGRAGHSSESSSGALTLVRHIVRLSKVIALCWAGHLTTAKEMWALVSASLQPHESTPEVDLLSQWVRTELSWASKDYEAALEDAAALIKLAGQVEFEQLAYLGHLILAQMHEELGQPGLALTEMRELRKRELRVRRDILGNRQKVVQAQLDVRTSERRLAHMAMHSEELERLSFEDMLTGLPNRRRFEQLLNQQLGESPDPQHPTCVALIDVDNFKHVNDTYTHAAGDDVLRAVADALRSCVRESDTPARLAGDEFVVLFPHTTQEDALLVCERISETVANLSFAPMAAGLQVTVSVGMSQAQSGDTPASLLHRSDLAMFRNKSQGASEGVTVF